MKPSFYNKPYQTDFPLKRSQKVIIDTDPGCDDIHAILITGYLAKKYDIEVLGVTVAFGNSTIGNCVKNAAWAVHRSGLKGVQVYQGEGSPLLFEDRYADNFFEPDGMGGVGSKYHQETDPNIIDKSISATDFIINSIRKYPQEIDIWTFGPLTNLAQAIHKEEKLPDLVNNVISCGTSYLGVGLSFENFVAEFNIYNDVEAACIVAKQLHRWYLIPFETVMEIPNNKETNQQLFEVDSDKGKLVKEIFQETFSQIGRYYLSDPLVALISAEPGLVSEWYYQYCEIETNTGSRGRLKVDWFDQSKLTPNCVIVQNFDHEKLIDLTYEAMKNN